MGRLYVYRGRRREAVYELEGAGAVLGRNLDSDIHLDDPLASRQHAKIVPGENGSLQLIDLGSGNGVYVDGERVETVPLTDGLRIAIGRHVLFYREAGALSSVTASALRVVTDVDLRDLVSGDASVRERITTKFPSVKLKEVQRQVEELLKPHLSFDRRLNRAPFLLEGDRYVIGYSDDCDLRLPGRNVLVKRAAEVLEDSNGGWLVVALNRFAALKVRGEPAKMAVLNDGDRFTIGKCKLTFHVRIG